MFLGWKIKGNPNHDRFGMFARAPETGGSGGGSVTGIWDNSTVVRVVGNKPDWFKGDLETTARALMAGLPGASTVQVFARSGQVSVKADGDDSAGETYTLSRRFFPTKEGVEAAHLKFKLRPDLQGDDTAKVMMRNALAEYKKLGVARIGLNAGKEGGGYAWAKFGFLPEKAGLADLSAQLVAKAKDIPGISTNTMHHIRGLAHSAKSLWEIAKDPQGYALLSKTNWSGFLDLHSDAQMDRCRNYIAKSRKSDIV